MLEELKATQVDISRKQEQIIQRVETLEESNIKFEQNRINVTKEISALTVLNNKVRKDVTQKFEALNLAVHYPAGPRLTGISELLEAILSYLPMKDLLLAQRVNSWFKEVIDNSLQLQRLLFFSPAPISANSTIYTVMMNPLLSYQTDPRSMPVLLDEHHTYLVSFGVNRLNHRDWVPIENKDIVPGVAADVELDIVYSGINSYRRPITQKKCYASGSWRRMFLTQPPCAVGWHLQPAITIGNNTATVTCGEVWLNDLHHKFRYLEKEPATVEEYAEYVKGIAMEREKARLLDSKPTKVPRKRRPGRR